MKKQIFILTFLSLALLFAGVSKSFGQYINYLQGTPTCFEATPLVCATEDALHPLPGKEYTYSITTSPEDVASVLWFVTDQPDVIEFTATGPVLQTTRDPGDGDGDYILTNSIYYNTATANKSIDISWKTFDALTNEVLLVAYVLGADGCSDNVEVYRIQPAFAFTLEIIALMNDGTVGDEDCVSPVESAFYDGANLVTDYGEDWVFFLVNAANFVHSWGATFDVTDNTGGSVVSEVEWAYPAQAILENGTWYDATEPIAAQVPGGAVDGDGECIVLRVRIDHGFNDISGAGTVAEITVSVNGHMYDPADDVDNYRNDLLRDLDDGETADDPCVQPGENEAIFTLTPRPALTSTTPASDTDPEIQDFEPKAAE